MNGIEVAQGEKWCPYCGPRGIGRVFNKEHVIPRSIGGALTPTNPFILSVCEPCNTACGFWVDAPFSRSWLVHNEYASAVRQYVALAPDTATIPFVFMGEMTDWKDPEFKCDLWLGPGGDHVFHFHAPYPKEERVILPGKPPNLKPSDFDAGVVFVTFTTSNPFWHPIIQRSLVAEFPGASIHFLNAGPDPSVKGPYPPVDPTHQRLVDWVKTLPLDGFWPVQLTVQKWAEERFIFKLGLGLGALILGEAFVRSTGAQRLRQALWTRDHDKRRELDTPRLGLLDHATNDPADKLLGWGRMHVLTLLDVGDFLALRMTVFGQYPLTLALCEDRTLWKDKIPPDGWCHVMEPGLRAHAGPITVADFLAHRNGVAPNPDLTALQQQIKDAPEPPPPRL